MQFCRVSWPVSSLVCVCEYAASLAALCGVEFGGIASQACDPIRAPSASAGSKTGRMRQHNEMIRKTFTILSLVCLVVSLGLWLIQLPGPIEFCSGPPFLDVKWEITENVPGRPGWGMWDATGAKRIDSKRTVLPWGGVEVPADEAPPLDILPDDSLLAGVGFGYLHLGFAIFNSIPDPVNPPRTGMVYVSSTHFAISVPFWLLVLLFSARPLYVMFCTYRRTRRKKQGLCVERFTLHDPRFTLLTCPARYENCEVNRSARELHLHREQETPRSGYNAQKLCRPGHGNAQGKPVAQEFGTIG